MLQQLRSAFHGPDQAQRAPAISPRQICAFDSSQVRKARKAPRRQRDSHPIQPQPQCQYQCHLLTLQLWSAVTCHRFLSHRTHVSHRKSRAADRGDCPGESIRDRNEKGRHTKRKAVPAHRTAKHNARPTRRQRRPPSIRHSGDAGPAGRRMDGGLTFVFSTVTT